MDPLRSRSRHETSIAGDYDAETDECAIGHIRAFLTAARNQGARQCKVQVRTQQTGPRLTRARETLGRDGVMGRGRQKAKDAKIARQLKYSNHGVDLRDLERELLTDASQARPKSRAEGKSDESDDLYDRWATDED